jgi:hypothetical protein
MNDLIKSLPSPSPTARITHTWMGESWMVDGEMSVIMMMKISSKSPSRQGARTEFLVLNRGFWWWRCSGTLSGKNVEPPNLSGQKVYIGGRRGRGDGRDGLTTPWRGLAWPAPPGVWAPRGLLCLVFWLRVSYGKIGILQYFLGFFLSWISAQKQDTREILLKTALVHVSCIQNT